MFSDYVIRLIMMIVIQSVLFSSDCHCNSITGTKIAKKSPVQPQPQTLQPAPPPPVVQYSQ